MKYLKKPVFIILIVVIVLAIASIIIVNNLPEEKEEPINKPLIPENSDVCDEMTKTVVYDVKGELEDYFKSNLFKVEEDTDRYEESIYNISNYGSILLKMNYKSVENGINNQYAFYDKKNNKIYSGYAYIDVIDTNKIYLGRYNDTNKTVSVSALSIDDNKINIIDEKAPYYNEKCFSYNSSTYFMTNKVAYFYKSLCEKPDKLSLYDKKFNKLNDNFKLYSYNEESNNVYVYKEGKIYIYDSTFKETIVEKANVIGLSATHAIFNVDSKVKVMSYEDIINGSTSLINTGVKFNSKMSLKDIGVLKEGVIMFTVVDAKKKETKYAFDVNQKLLMKYKKGKN